MKATKQMTRKEKRRIRATIRSIYQRIGMILLFGSMFYFTGIESTVKSVDPPLDRPIGGIIISIIILAIGAYIVYDSTEK